jgi:hypothetical protein
MGTPDTFEERLLEELKDVVAAQPPTRPRRRPLVLAGAERA